MGSNDKNFSFTGYEPKDYFITEAHVEFNQESVTEQRFPEDVDYDDAAIGQMLFDAHRGQVDHSKREGLSSGHEIQRQNSENEQIRTLLDRQREQILADCQAEIRKHEFQADYDRRSI